MFIRFDGTHERDRRTDGQTDTARPHIPRLCIASRGKNCAVGMLKLTTDKHEASRGLSATAELLVFGRGWSHLDKISQTCGDMVEIETRCRIPIWRMFGRIQWHVILEPLITLQGAATW